MTGRHTVIGPAHACTGKRIRKQEGIGHAVSVRAFRTHRTRHPRAINGGGPMMHLVLVIAVVFVFAASCLLTFGLCRASWRLPGPWFRFGPVGGLPVGRQPRLLPVDDARRSRAARARAARTSARLPPRGATRIRRTGSWPRGASAAWARSNATCHGWKGDVW